MPIVDLKKKREKKNGSPPKWIAYTIHNQDVKGDKSWNNQWFQQNYNKFVVGLELMLVLKWILTPLAQILRYIYDCL